MTKLFILTLTAIGIVTTGLEAQTLPVTYTGTSPIKFTIDANGQLFSTGTFDTTYSTSNLNSAATGAGARMLWYPSKAAFRAGYVNGTQWDDANIAPGSVTFGMNNKNSSYTGLVAGSGNTAGGGNNWSETNIGMSNTTYGMTSVALGIANFAESDFAVAIGENDSALGYYSQALGQFNVANGTCSSSIGCGNQAYGYTSISLGSNSQTSGDYSTTLGVGCSATSMSETVVGSYNSPSPNANPHNWVATDEIFAVGNGTTSTSSNALTVYKNGNAALHGSLTVAPSGDIPMYTGN